MFHIRSLLVFTSTISAECSAGVPSRRGARLQPGSSLQWRVPLTAAALSKDQFRSLFCSVGRIAYVEYAAIEGFRQLVFHKNAKAVLFERFIARHRFFTDGQANTDCFTSSGIIRVVVKDADTGVTRRASSVLRGF